MSSNILENSDDLLNLKNWLKEQPHLPDTWHDQGLHIFLKNCSSLEKSKSKLDAYFTMRNAAPELFAKRVVSTARAVTEFAHLLYLPQLTPDCHKIGIISSFAHDFNPDVLLEAVKAVFMMNDIRLLSDGDEVLGDVYLVDLTEGDCAYILKNLPFSIIKKAVISVTNVYPLKIKGIHILSTSAIFKTAISLVKPFLKEKIRKRIHMHATLDSLHKHIHKESLPKEFGGNAGLLADLGKEWWDLLEKYQEWFAAEEGVKTDETKRKGQKIKEMFNVLSFSKLNID